MKFFKFAILAILAVGTLVSCRKSSDNLAESIPAGAESVTHINMESLIKKSNYNIFENATVKRGINMAKAMLKSESAVKLIEDFEKNSSAFGVTLNKDAYFFTKGSYFGLLLPVNDAKKIKESLTKFNVDASSIKLEKGVYSFPQTATFNVVWNDEKLLVLVQQTSLGQDTTQLSAIKLLTLDQKESILSDKNFEKFSKEQQDISVYYSSSLYADLSSKFENLNKSPYTIGVDKTSQEVAEAFKKIAEEFKGISFGSFISFENGKIKTHTQYYFETPEVETKAKKMAEQTTGEISEKYLQCISQAPILSFVANLKGTGYYNLLTQLGLSKTIATLTKENGIDLKSLIESVNGNVVFSLNELTLIPKDKNLSEMDAMLTLQDNTAKPKFKLSLLAELAPNNKIGTFIDSLLAKQSADIIKKTGKAQYSVKKDDLEGFFGVKNNTFYFTTEAATVANLGNTNPKNTYADKVKGKSCYLYGDFRPLRKFALDYFTQEGGPQAAQYKDLVTDGLSLIETVEGYVKPDLTNEATVNFTNKKDNSLASIFKYLDTVLTKLGAQQGL
ncbi:MAG: hypothetical protein H6Q14_1788 [Bacteroidetes bacterium]|nr:hypothetical protein [Bacteroidota bacterium]